VFFFVEYFFREGNNYTDLVQEKFANCRILTPPDFYLWGAAKSAVYRDRPRMLNELKPSVTAYIRKISQADPQKVIANKINLIKPTDYVMHQQV
jgi:hypothetical protein